MSARVLVTGGAGGLGRAIARRFVADGASVALLDRDEDAVRRAATELGSAALAVVADLTDPASTSRGCASALDGLGGLDVLVNNAGIETVAPLLETSDEQLEHLFAVNVLGALRCTRAVAGALAESPHGVVVTMSSVAGTGGSPLLGGYAMTKAAVISMTQTLGFELRPLGIRAVAVCPALIGPTRMVDALVEPFEALAGVPFDEVLRGQGRMGTPEEVAALVAHLTAPGAAMVSGTHVVIDGGLTAGLL